MAFIVSGCCYCCCCRCCCDGCLFFLFAERKECSMDFFVPFFCWVCACVRVWYVFIIIIIRSTSTLSVVVFFGVKRYCEVGASVVLCFIRKRYLYYLSYLFSSDSDACVRGACVCMFAYDIDVEGWILLVVTLTLSHSNRQMIIMKRKNNNHNEKWAKKERERSREREKERMWQWWWCTLFAWAMVKSHRENPLGLFAQSICIIWNRKEWENWRNWAETRKR